VLLLYTPLVIEPKQGMYHNVVVVDAASLYPTMAIHYNISFDTVNCKCCKKNPRAKIKLNKAFFKDCKFISKTIVGSAKIQGAFTRKLKIFRQERLQQKKLANMR
jgi:DNA polymerase elongation subunit (family B)